MCKTGNATASFKFDAWPGRRIAAQRTKRHHATSKIWVINASFSDIWHGLDSAINSWAVSLHEQSWKNIYYDYERTWANKRQENHFRANRAEHFGQRIDHTSLFSKLLDVFKPTNFFATSSSDSMAPCALVPTSSLFLTLTDRLSSSCWPTTVIIKVKKPVFVNTTRRCMF